MATMINDVTIQAAEPQPNEQLELARYRIPSGERKLVGRRVSGEAILIDMPVGDDGRVYLVERDLDQDGYSALLALVADYVSVSQAIQAIPASSPLPNSCQERASE